MTSAELDPVTFEIIRNRLEVIVDEMQSTILRVSHSSIIKDALDATAALFDVQGNTLAQASAVPVHLQMLIPAVRRVLVEFPPDAMRQGDMYVMNDPYDGGTHLPDVTLILPVFAGDVPVALSCTMAHHQDIGGAVAGSTSASAREIFAEGLIVPVLRLYDGGRLNQDLLELMQRNVRVPTSFRGDLMAQVACCKTGARRLTSLFEEYGVPELVRYLEALLDHAEQRSHTAIEAIPDGTYRFADYIDGNGLDPHRPVRIEATVTIDGSELRVDFAGTDPEAAGAINCVPSSTDAGVYFVARALMGPDTSSNAGAYRPITISAPPGTIVNPRRPRAVGARTITVHRIASAVQGAVAQAVPEAVPAAHDGSSNLIYVGGYDPDGRESYVTLLGIPTCGGSGARADRDGVDVIHAETDNLRTVPAEAFEQEYPFRVVSCDLWSDSGGPGRWRGGLGNHTVVELLCGEAALTVRRDRHDFQPWGLFGGTAAPRNRTLVHRRGGTTQELAATGLVRLAAGDRIECFTTGGGGYGDPLLRETWRVRDDVLDRAVSVAAARSVYGVVLEGPERKIDAPRTEQLRAELATRRGPASWTYDRGEGYAAITGRSRYETP